MRSIHNLLCLCLLVPWLTVPAQQVTTALVVKMDGYIIQLEGSVIFQPAPDSTLGFWQSLDNSSFDVWCNQFNDFPCAALEGLGKKVKVSYRSGANSKWYNSSLRYFYATVEVVLPVLSTDSNEFQLYKTPYYTLTNNQKNYPIVGFHVQNRLLKIVPAEKGCLLKLRAWFEQKGWHIPEWLEREKS